MRMSIKIIVGTAIVAAAVTAASLGASAPARASEKVAVAPASDVTTDMSARKRTANRSTSLRVSRLSRRAAEPPNPNRPYYRPVPSFFPFGQDRGYF